MGFTAFIGQKLLPTESQRVSAPPGEIEMANRRSILLATPMRSGTHITMDLIMNALPQYRRKPLYINLDAYLLQDKHRGAAVDIGRDLGQAGYVIKTHFPSGRVATKQTQMEAVARAALVVVVDRPTEDIRQSLERWVAAEPGLPRITRQLVNLDAELEAFHAFWSQFNPYRIAFRDLFDAARCAAIVADIARLTEHPEPFTHNPAPPVSRAMQVYMNKGLTRILGHRAPRIDTSIRALR
jgi:hypothetical protein